MLKKKRGFSQVDWAVSLAIFLLYLAWFFMYVKPSIIEPNLLVPSYEKIRASLVEELSQEVITTPFFVFSNQSMNKQLLEVNISFLEGEKTYLKTSKPYVILDETLYVLDDLVSGAKIYYLVSSDQTYPSNNTNALGIIEENNIVNPNSKLLIKYGNTIDEVYYGEVLRIKDFAYFQEGEQLGNLNFESVNKDVFLDLVEEFQPFTSTTKIVLESDNYKTKIKRNDAQNNHNMTISFEAVGFTDYFIDNDNYDSLDVSQQKCVVSNNKEIMLSDENNESMSIVFNKEVDINICYEDYEALLSFTFINQNMQYQTIFSNQTISEYETVFGVPITKYEIMLLGAGNLTEQSIKTSANVNENFAIRLYNTTIKDTQTRRNNTLLSIGGYYYDPNTIVYSKDEIVKVQDKYLNQERMTLHVTVW
ncbi:hypothetical protein GOV05_05065 [Candidatus Woesearchaeota archaeon]|nr:hypothetical protein [Candidatus Woesearchaeota archaeon]